MPYKKLSDLPQPIKDHLPKEAQKIYKAAFNEAWDEYADPKNRRDDSSREEVAHKVAWSSVKKKYKKTKIITGSKNNCCKKTKFILRDLENIQQTIKPGHKSW